MAASGINPDFLVDEAISYSGIGITTPTRSNPRSSTPAGFGLGSPPEQLPIGEEEQLFHDWVEDWPNTESPVRRSSTPVRRSATPPPSRSRSISSFFSLSSSSSSSSTLPTPPPPRTPPYEELQVFLQQEEI